MKSFANCTPDEFMAQAVKIRAPFVEWVEKIGIPEIRARRPEGYDEMSLEDKKKAITKMARENMGDILAIAFEKNAEMTKKIICMATFTDPEDFNDHPMVEYLTAIAEMLGNEAVRGFFMYYLAPMLKTSIAG